MILVSHTFSAFSASEPSDFRHWAQQHGHHCQLRSTAVG
jgi:hypothetical protein